MKVRISAKGYKNKPNKNEYFDIVEELKKPFSNVDLKARQIAYAFQNGYALILAEYKEGAEGILGEDVIGTEYLGLDIDSKENPITLNDMKELLLKELDIYPVIAYRTFSDVDCTRFRLIYHLGKKLDREKYKALYKALVSRYGKYLDNATSNINRIWQGTNKPVYVYPEQKEISSRLIAELIAEHEKEKQLKAFEFQAKRTERILFEDDILNRVHFDKNYLNQITDIINTQINIYDFIKDKFGGNYKKIGNRLEGCCPLHGGNNSSAFSIFLDTNTYSCFTHCGSGNVLSLAYKYYKTHNFASVVIKLMQEYDLKVPEESIKIKPS